jgi:hypothetical protein
MSRWGKRWLSVPGQTSAEVAGSHRVGGRYVARKPGQRYEFGGVRFKSRYEQNYAAFLTFLGIAWQYEPKTFRFGQLTRGTTSYRPDFYLPASREFHETKGYLDRRSRVQLKRMKKYYPQVKLVLIDAAFFASVERQRLCRVIPGWVCQHQPVR